MNTTERWERLAREITESGVPARLGWFRESPSITIRLGGTLQVNVNEHWNRIGKWDGYRVWVEDRKTSFQLYAWRQTSKRSEVIAHIAASVERHGLEERQ